MALLKIDLAVSACFNVKECRFGDFEVLGENAGVF